MGFSTGWETISKTNAILADIYDLLQLVNRNLVAANSKKKIKETITPYPRPGRDNNARKIGKSAMPLADLREWMNKKRKAKQRKGEKSNGKRRNG